jgi:hypothetical protein
MASVSEFEADPRRQLQHARTLLRQATRSTIARCTRRARGQPPTGRPRP